MRCKERLEAYLHEQKVSFQVQHHTQVFSALRTAETEHISSETVAKTVIVLADQRMFMLVLPASFRVDLNRIQAILKTKELRLAYENEFASMFPDCEVGATPPFGNLYGLPVYVEQRLAERETIVFPAGTHTETIRLKYADFERLVEPHTATFTMDSHG